MTETETLAAEEPAPLAEDELRLIDAYWRAANYLSVAQIYLLDNPAAARAVAAGAHQASAARSLRHGAGPQPALSRVAPVIVVVPGLRVLRSEVQWCPRSGAASAHLRSAREDDVRGQVARARRADLSRAPDVRRANPRT